MRHSIRNTGNSVKCSAAVGWISRSATAPNSAGIVEGLDSNGLDMVRAGISIYGLYPSDEVARDRVKLVPAMELKSFITYIKTIGPGTAVSYGGTFVADRPMRVATIPVGYGDGYLRSLSNKGAVLIRGKRAEILGRDMHGPVYGRCHGHPGGRGRRPGDPHW